MANATWKAIKNVFASETTTTTLGSTITGSPQTSTDPEILSVNWNKGLDGNWQEVTINGTQYWLPLVSEWNGVYSCFSQYLKQLFENGFVLWSEKQTYNLTPAPSIVKDPVSSKLYITLVDNNKGNILTDNTKWKFLCDLNDLTYLQSSKFNTANNLVQTNSENQLPSLDGTLLLNTKYIPQRIILSNNTTNPNTQINFASGNFEFSDKTNFATFTAITGDITLNFGNGLGMLDTGTRANSTWYYCYAIYNPTTQLSRVICSVSAPNLITGAYTGSNMPSGFTKNRYIGAFRTNASGNIVAGTWEANGYFKYATSITENFDALITTTNKPLTLTVPLVKIRPLVSCYWQGGSVGSRVEQLIFTSNLTGEYYMQAITFGSGISFPHWLESVINTMIISNGVIQYRASVGGAQGFNPGCYTNGYIDLLI